MSGPTKGRLIGDLTYVEIGTMLRASSILCLPMGSMEQHGPHLPLGTDTVIAEALTVRIVERWGDAFDLWRLPAVTTGLSREHEWAPGTLSLSVAGMNAHLRDLGREVARSLPSRNLLIVNGHGGNRGILEALGRELRGDFGLNICAMHLGAIISPVPAAGVPEIHAGCDETSVMLALAPDLVRRERLGDAGGPAQGDAIRSLVLDPAASWPWSSGDPRISAQGVMGDARDASAEHGHVVIERVLAAAEPILREIRAAARG